VPESWIKKASSPTVIRLRIVSPPPFQMTMEVAIVPMIEMMGQYTAENMAALMELLRMLPASVLNSLALSSSRTSVLVVRAPMIPSL